MSLTLRVTYAATDGSVPESVELEWPDVQPTASMVLPLLDRLLRVATDRAADARPESSDYRLEHGARRGEILAVGADGTVRNVGAFRPGTKFDRAGQAAESLKAGEVIMVNGLWHQKETA